MDTEQQIAWERTARAAEWAAARACAEGDMTAAEVWARRSARARANAECQCATCTAAAR